MGNALEEAKTFDHDVTSALRDHASAMEMTRQEVGETLKLNEAASNNTTTVACASKEINAKMETVAPASEQLAASSSEIGERIAETMAKGRSLAESSHRIEEVISREKAS